jgi:hypothetical protein
MSQPSLTPRMRRLLERASDIGTEWTGTPCIGTEKVLRAMVDDNESGPAGTGRP